MGAANALTVYPHIARGIFQTTNAHDPDLVHRYANQLAQVLTKLRPHARPTESPPSMTRQATPEQVHYSL